MGVVVGLALCMSAMAEEQFWIGTAPRDGAALPKSIAIIDEIVAAKPKPWVIKTFDGASHGLYMPYDKSLPFPHSPFADGYFDTIAAWLKERGLSQ